MVVHKLFIGVVFLGSEDMKRLTRAGATLITHLGNGAPPKLPRHNNVIQAGLLEDRLSASLITDGRHVPNEFIQLVLKTKGLVRVMVVSDVAPVAGNVHFKRNAPDFLF